MNEIKFNTTETKIINILLNTVKEKSPTTILRIAGGYVRDKLLGIDSHDIDIAVDNMSGESFAKLVFEYMKEHNIKNKGKIAIIKANPKQSKHVATATLSILDMPIDFVNLRKETYSSNSRIPTVEPGTAKEDASRRDLTINSLFYNLNTNKIEDFVGGLEDLKNKIARTPTDAITTFKDDPLRILRTIRFAAKYNLKLDPNLIEAAKDPDVQIALKNKISKERIWKELSGQAKKDEWKPGALTGKDPHRAVQLLEQLGLRDILFGLSDEEQKQLDISKGMVSLDSDQMSPHHDLTIWNHTLKVLEYLVKHQTTKEQQDKLEDYLVRNLAAILHDAGKCDICTIQMYPENHPEYKEKLKKIKEKYNIEHLGELRTYQGHEDSSAKIAQHILTRMKAPNKIIERVVNLVKAHMRPHQMIAGVSASALRRFVKELGNDWRHSLDLAIADAYGKDNIHDPDLKQKYINVVNKIEEILTNMGNKTHIKPPISGHDIMQELNVKPGPIIGKVMKALEEKLLENPSMSKEEALSFIKKVKLKESIHNPINIFLKQAKIKSNLQKTAMLINYIGGNSINGAIIIAYKENIFIINNNITDVEYSDLTNNQKQKFRKLLLSIDIMKHFDKELNTLCLQDVIEYLTDHRSDVFCGDVDNKKNLYIRWNVFTFSPISSILLHKLQKALNIKNIIYHDEQNTTSHDKTQLLGKLPEYFYHGTIAKNVLGILHTGLMPKPENSNYKNVIIHNKHIFIATDFYNAAFHAEHTAYKNQHKNDNYPIVLKIKIPDTSKLVPDWDIDVGTSETIWKKPNTNNDYFSTQNLDSMKVSKEIGLLGYNGRIPPNFIEGIYIKEPTFFPTWTQITKEQFYNMIEFGVPDVYDDEYDEENDNEENENE